MTDASLRLRRLDACAVSDALDKLGIPNQVSVGLPHRSESRKFSGRCVTMRLVAAADAPARSGPPRHLGTTAIERAERGEVIVVEQRTGTDAGCWGGILSLAATVCGVAGVVADGPVRDIDEARSYGLPVACRSFTPRTARARVAEIETNGPVCIDGVSVKAGDFVVADGSGVVFIPAERIHEVLDAAESIARREALMAKALLAGRPPSEVMGANYEHMLNKDHE